MEISIMKNKSALVIGANGMVGTALMRALAKNKNYFLIKGVDIETDMTIKANTEIIKDFDHVYHVAGIKGSPQRAKQRPADYLPMLQFDSNIIEAVGKYKPEWFLYTSSIGVYPPMPVFKEGSVWLNVPSANDMIPAYIKRMGELGCYAIKETYGYSNISIVRPANIYGPGDNFGDESTVIASLIKKAFHDDNDTLSVWGDGSPIRDFIYVDDVARGMIHMVENKVEMPVNLGSGEQVRIKDIAEIIANHYERQIEYDTSKPIGDPKRQMDTERAESFGFKPKVSLKKGIENTIEYYEQRFQ